MGLPIPLPPHNLRRQPWVILLLLVGVLVMCTASASAGFEHVQKTMDTDAVLRFSGPPANMTLAAFQNFTYQQTLDHFNYLPSSYTTFPHRYRIDFTHWGGAGTGSPILLYTGAESALEDELAAVGYHVHAAPALRALVVFIEHRYYGLSVPFGSPAAAHRDADTLGYLSASQALADYAEIILHIQEMYDARGPVIAIGCSYGGMLSAYFRLKYPHVVHGALSSSGPVLYVNGDVSSRRDYHDVISADFMACTELMFPLGPGGGPQSMFEPNPFRFQSYKSFCNRKYGVEPRERWMATAYNITQALEQFGSNIIFSNGLRDPYSAGGVLQDISPSIVALTTQEGSHCLDVLHPQPATDPQWLIDQRDEEMRIIRGWITTFHSSFNPRDDQ
ncbi:hypothetical protein Taro_036680 [Colocasia esculenta]|uniref:Lysosomal Pro-X carboxypeptidase n=1 Tax=Colocasia esculenta TaxID=4460 RepID=A0A843VY81_COLES|nr:hypothetical protein [Colocasia esculenta]